MAIWKVVLLVNVALVFGVSAGYIRWGREATRLQLALEAATAPALGVEREFRGEGVVRAIMPETDIVVITHGDIPGYMPPMTMGFRSAPRVYDAVRVGDSVRFVLRGVVPNLQIVGMDKAS